MDIYNFINQKYLEQQRTGKSSIKFPELKIKKVQSQSSKKLNSDKLYSCGHSNNNEWKNSESDLCIECWLKNNRYMVNYEK